MYHWPRYRLETFPHRHRYVPALNPSVQNYANIHTLACMPTLLFTGWNMMQTVVLKDKKNKEAHEESARLACEAAAAVKTVASLTQEQGFVDAYSRSLGEPLRVANRSTIIRMFWFGCTQSTVFFVNALVSIYPISLP